MATAEKLFHQIGTSSIKHASKKQMFGWPCYKIGKTAFISFENDCIVCKLSEQLIKEALKLQGSYTFIPNQKTPMKNWVCIPYKYKQLWKHYAEEAQKLIKL